MEKQRNRRNYIIGLVQAVAWAAMFCLPAITTWIVNGSLETSLDVLRATVKILLPLFALYAVNYYLLVPQFYWKQGQRKWFFLANVALILIMDLMLFFPGQDIPQEVLDTFGQKKLWTLYAISMLMILFAQALLILLAVGIRNTMRNNELQVQYEQERRKTAEAELVWLKHQLNPHFLFNTLNNISSLTQIDPDQAQERIGQLSDLLRYALYDSEAETVPLAAEMEFMSNYVDLMALRCNGQATVEKDFAVPAEKVEVAPLLFISLVENAFKHGVNARYPSFVRISMGIPDPAGDDGKRKVVFRCENSLFEKQGPDHIGSGIGLENMLRRLELLYAGKYTYRQRTEDGCYKVEVTLEV